MIYSDILNKTKQGKAFHILRFELMNVPEDYDYEVEQINTNPYLFL